MEKRLLFAFILSFLILYFWSALFPSATKTTNSSKISKLYENKEVERSPVVIIEKTDQKPSSAREKLDVLENAKLKVILSNIGAQINEIKIKEYNETLPITRILSNENFKDLEFSVLKNNPQTILYSAKVGKAEILKEYTLSQEDYVINVQIEVRNADKMSNLRNLNFIFDFDATRMDIKLKNSRDIGLIDYAMDLGGNIFRKGSLVKYSEADKGFIINKNTNETRNNLLKWIGVRNGRGCGPGRPGRAIGLRGARLPAHARDEAPLQRRAPGRDEAGRLAGERRPRPGGGRIRAGGSALREAHRWRDARRLRALPHPGGPSPVRAGERDPHPAPQARRRPACRSRPRR